MATLNASPTADPPAKPYYPRGFRPTRGLNWGYLGLLYTTFYLCRYNLSIANKSISDELHLSYSDMSNILTAWTLCYAFGQIINGLITDRIGGKWAMLIGAFGTIVLNVLFGAASAWGILGLFIAIRGIDGYVQSFGAPGMTKIKTAWFAKTERGGFAGIFGFMINLGRFGIFTFGPALLAGFTILGMINVDPLHWKWLFWGPSIICAIVAIAMAFEVKEAPEEHGYLHIEDYAGPNPKDVWVGRGLVTALILVGAAVAVGFLYHRQVISKMDMGLIFVAAIVIIFLFLHHLARKNKLKRPEHTLSREEVAAATRADVLSALKAILRNPAVWLVAMAYACTGAVRQPVDQWFPRYMQEVFSTDLKSVQFQFLAFLIPLVASAGSWISGIISDKLFAGGRAPVASGLYLIEAAVVFFAFLFVKSANMAVLFFVLISFTANSTHSILGTAAAMDIGGRKMTGFAAGLIDSFQYFGASLGLWGLGHILDGWGFKYYFLYMVPFGLIGFGLMFFGRKVIERHSHG